MESIGEATGTVNATESWNGTGLALVRRRVVVVKAGPATDVCDGLWCHEPALGRTLVVHLSGRGRFLLTLAHGDVLSLQPKLPVLGRLVMRCPTWSGRMDCCPYRYRCACLPMVRCCQGRRATLILYVGGLRRAAGVHCGAMVCWRWDALTALVKHKVSISVIAS